MNEKMFCNILEAKYLKMLGNSTSDESYSNYDSFPSGWFSNRNYEFKMKILLEALENQVLIVETSLYKKSIEDLHLNK